MSTLITGAAITGAGIIAALAAGAYIVASLAPIVTALGGGA